MSRRSYDSPVRDESARLTRRRIVEAARTGFLSAGYAQTTMGSIAAAAGVSQQTVYARIGNKAAVLKAVYDVGMAGDDEPVPIAARPETRALAALTEAAELFAQYAHQARLMATRMRPLLELVHGVRAVEPDLDQLARTTAGERRIGSTIFATHVVRAGFVRPGLGVDEVVELVWVLNAPEVYLLHVRDGSMTDDDYERWLAGALHACLVGTARPVG